MITTTLNDRTGRAPGAPRVLAVYSYRFDAHLVPDMLANVAPMVDGWVAYDDRQASGVFSAEPPRRLALLRAARDAGADWVLAVDPDERYEHSLAARMDELTMAEGATAYGFNLREMYAPGTYRMDGVWGKKLQARLLKLPEELVETVAPLHSSWHSFLPEARVVRSGVNLYHLKMITAERRRARARLYNLLDPNRESQARGYDYLAEDEGAVFEDIPAGQEYFPAHDDDGGLWMQADLADATDER